MPDYGMKIIIEFGNGIYYELDSTQLNPKQIELISHMLDLPEMLDFIEAE